MSYTISTATVNDADVLVPLINSAYRGEEAKKGWTHEADLIEGSIRTDKESLTELIQKKEAAILKYTSNQKVLGCVYLEKQDTKLYLGMLTVSPQLQGGGIGKILLQASEGQAKKWNCTSIIMNVIPQRDKLIAWYEKRGYKDSGKRKPFPDDGKFGKPREPLEFCILEKHL